MQFWLLFDKNSKNTDRPRCFIFLEEIVAYASWVYQILEHWLGFMKKGIL